MAGRIDERSERLAQEIMEELENRFFAAFRGRVLFDPLRAAAHVRTQWLLFEAGLSFPARSIFRSKFPNSRGFQLTNAVF
jgi:hypothetical protein